MAVEHDPSLVSVLSSASIDILAFGAIQDHASPLVTSPISADSCLWCRTGIAEPSIEHIVPEPLGCPPELAKSDLVCRRCNNGLGYVDQGLVRDLGMLATMKGLRGKKGRLPIGGWAAMGSRTRPGEPELFVNFGPGDVDTPVGRLKAARRSNGIFDGSIETEGRHVRMRWKQHIGSHPHFVRAAYKVGLGLCAHFMGKEYALQPAFDPVRAFVNEGVGSFRVLLMAAEHDRANHFPAPYIEPVTGLPCVEMALLGVDFLIDLDAQQRGIKRVSNYLAVAASPPSYSILPLRPSR